MEINDWILNILSVKHPAFSNMPPCPYAKKALLDGKIDIVEGLDLDLAASLLAEQEVIVFKIIPSFITPEDLTELVMRYNEKYPDIMFLEDHPDEIETVDGMVVNNGTYVCVFATLREKIIAAREYLKTTSYYDNWTEEYKKAVWSR